MIRRVGNGTNAFYTSIYLSQLMIICICLAWDWVMLCLGAGSKTKGLKAPLP